MDKTSWIAVILCSIGIVYFMPKSPKPQPGEGPKTEETTSPANGEPTPPVTTTGGGVTKPVDGAEAPVPVVDAAPTVAEETHIISTKEAEFTFTNIGAGIKSARMINEKSDFDEKEDVIINDYSSYPVGALSSGIGDVETTGYTIKEKTNRSITFEGDVGGGLVVIKTYTLLPEEQAGADFTFNLKMYLQNKAGTATFNDERYIYLGLMAPLYPKETSYQRGMIFYRDGKTKVRNVDYYKKQARQNETESCEQLWWAGMLNQFFATNISSEVPYDAYVWAKRKTVELNEGEIPEGTTKADATVPVLYGAMSLPQLEVPVGQQQELNYQIFMGPKEYANLRDMGREREGLMRYKDLPLLGWMAAPFSKILMSALVKIQSFTGNYGIAIILITLIIRIIIWPLHNKSQRTMKRMSLLGPKMTELREKFKDNPQKMNTELMKLYKDYGVNPFGGCLPIFLQMPIFLGFFQMLRSAVELRHESFLWVDDLSLPDTLFTIPGLGIPFNLLPILMGITMVIQMKVTPKAGDKTQQKIFMFMPLIFLVICYNFASALALYWTSQNIISTIQTLITKRMPDPVLKKKEAPAKPAPAGQKPKKKRGPRTGG